MGQQPLGQLLLAVLIATDGADPGNFPSRIACGNRSLKLAGMTRRPAQQLITAAGLLVLNRNSAQFHIRKPPSRFTLSHQKGCQNRLGRTTRLPVKMWAPPEKNDPIGPSRCKWCG